MGTESENRPVLLQSLIRDVSFGVDVKVVEPVNLYECGIGDKCFVGPFVEVQKGVSIGARTKIQSHSLVCELVDPFLKGGPARGDRNLWRPTRIGNRVSIGSNATILPVTVCDDVVIGAAAVVTKNITEPGVYAGNPARKRPSGQ